MQTLRVVVMQGRLYCVKKDASVFLTHFHCFHSIPDTSSVLDHILLTCLNAAQLRHATHTQTHLK